MHLSLSIFKFRVFKLWVEKCFELKQFFAGTSTSLPATTVEVAKAALGMTNPATASDFPVVCDSCLSPSKLGFVDETIECISYRFINSQYCLRKNWDGIAYFHLPSNRQHCKESQFTKPSTFGSWQRTKESSKSEWNHHKPKNEKSTFEHIKRHNVRVQCCSIA